MPLHHGLHSPPGRAYSAHPSTERGKNDERPVGSKGGLVGSNPETMTSMLRAKRKIMIAVDGNQTHEAHEVGGTAETRATTKTPRVLPDGGSRQMVGSNLDTTKPEPPGAQGPCGGERCRPLKTRRRESAASGNGDAIPAEHSQLWGHHSILGATGGRRYVCHARDQ